MTHVFSSVEIQEFARGNGINERVAVKTSTVDPVDLSADLNGANIDGVSLAPGDRLLVRGQVTRPEFEIDFIANTAGVLTDKYWTFSTFRPPFTEWYVWYGPGAGPGPLPGVGIPIVLELEDSADVVCQKTAAALREMFGVDLEIYVTGSNMYVIQSIRQAVAAPAADVDTGFTITDYPSTGSAIEHGIYIIGAGAGETYRAPDLAPGDQAANITVIVQEGGGDRKGSYVQVLAGIVGTDSQEWHQRTLDLPAGRLPMMGPDGQSMQAIQPFANSVLVAGPDSIPFMTTQLPTGVEIDGPFTQPLQIVNKSYVDSVAAGLDPKESVRFRTLTDIGGVYATSPSNGQFTDADSTNAAAFDLDGQTMQVGDRVLIMNQADPLQNGIYVAEAVGGGTSIFTRAADQNGNPASNVSGGNFTFVELGAQYEATGWVLQGDGVLTLNTDPLNWVQFSAYQSLTAGSGITISGGEVSARLLANGGVVFNGASPNGELQVDLSASNISGTLATNHGGTGQTTYTAGDQLVGTGGDSLAIVPVTAQRVWTADQSGVVAWRTEAHLDTIRGASATNPIVAQFANTDESVNYVAISNALVGGAPGVSAAGTDTNVNLRLAPKGTGAIIAQAATNPGEIRFMGLGGNYTALAAGNPGADVKFTLPEIDGTTGQVMTTNGSGVLTFTSISTLDTIPIISSQVNATGTTLIDAAYFNWSADMYVAKPSRTFNIYTVVTGGKTLEVQVYDLTNAAQLGLGSFTTTGMQSIAFTGPVADAMLAFRIRKTTASGDNPQILSARIA